MANQYIYNLTDTWNNVATTFDAIKINVTDTASAAGSKLLNLQVGGSTKFAVGNDGSLTLENSVISYSKIQNVSATDKLLGRSTAGAGVIEEVTCTAAGRALLDDASAADQRTTLGLGSGSDVTFAGLTVTEDALNATPVTVSGYSLTGANVQPLMNLTGTWNTSGNASGITLNITNTASGASSDLMRLQTGGTNQFRVTKTGGVKANEYYVGDTAVTVSTVWIGLVNTGTLRSSTTETKLLGTAGFGWVASNVTSETIDTALWRDAANNLAQRNGTNAQTFRVYNTSTSSNANYERGKLEWASDIFRIGTEKGGTGTSARAMHLQTDGTTALTLTTAQKAEFAATIKTAAPAGGTAAEWKLGVAAIVTPTSPNRTIEVDIGGTIYYVHAKTTND